MLRPYIILTDARAPHPDWPRARVPGVAVARLAVSRSARLSGAAREPSRSQASGRRERRDDRAGLVRWDEAGGVVFDLDRHPPPFTALAVSVLVILQLG